MKILSTVVIATGCLAAVAVTGVAVAAETDAPSQAPTSAIAAAAPTAEPVETLEPVDQLEDGPGDVESSGLRCVLVPIAEAPLVEAPGEDSIAEEETRTIAEALEGNTIECSGTGNERSATVALLPRFLAHSGEWTGAEKGAAISEWAHTHPNKKAHPNKNAEPEPVEIVDPADPIEEPTETDDAPGRSGDAPGHGGGNGNGGGNGHGGGR